MPNHAIVQFFELVASDFRPRRDVTDITDHFFLHIEFSQDRLRRYRRLVSRLNVHQVNLGLGRLVKQEYNLGNVIRNHRPMSTLIKSYMRHSQP
jgi:hypothetical protein